MALARHVLDADLAGRGGVRRPEHHAAAGADGRDVNFTDVGPPVGVWTVTVMSCSTTWWASFVQMSLGSAHDSLVV